MNRKEILDAVRSLAKSQGYYGRLLSYLEENDELLDELESQHFNDVLDMVLFLEC